MADAFVGIDEPSLIDKKVDCVEFVNEDDEVVLQQRIVDRDALTKIARLDSLITGISDVNALLALVASETLQQDVLDALNLIIGRVPTSLEDGRLSVVLPSSQVISLTTLESLATSIRDTVQGTLAIAGTVALDGSTLAALETIHAVIDSGTVALDTPTLAALESITAAVTGSVELGATTLAALEAITATISGTVTVAGTVSVGNFPVTQPVSGTIALDAPTLAALETVNAVIQSGAVVGLDSSTLAALENIVVSGTIALDSTTLTALETITAAVTGTVDLSTSTLAALESITATLSGAVTIGNFPADYPLPDAQVTALTPQTDALTDVQLRASAVSVEDDFATVEHLADQSGTGAVLTFTAATAGEMVWVDVDPDDPADMDLYRCRATVDGSNPTSSLGWVCRPGPNPIPIPMSGTAVKVWAPAGVTVAVQVMQRA